MKQGVVDQRRRLVISAMLSLMTFLTFAAPAHAATTTTLKGSVQAPYGSAIGLMQYEASGCTPNVPDGTFSAYFTVSGSTSVTIKIGKTDTILPTGSPSLGANLYAGCAPGTVVPKQPSCQNISAKACTLPVNGARFLEVLFSCSTSCFWVGTHFTVAITKS